MKTMIPDKVRFDLNLQLDCCDLDWRSLNAQLIKQAPPYFAS